MVVAEEVEEEGKGVPGMACRMRNFSSSGHKGWSHLEAMEATDVWVAVIAASGMIGGEGGWWEERKVLTHKAFSRSLRSHGRGR